MNLINSHSAAMFKKLHTGKRSPTVAGEVLCSN